MQRLENSAIGAYVALRKESVDRKVNVPNFGQADTMSLSARRAWIEKDRDFGIDISTTGRSPQGERG